jgi:tetratricopeptide (TPR) repeat protein
VNTRQTLDLERQRLTERYQEQPEGRVFAPLADCHRKLGNLDQALQICQRGLTRHPEYSSAHVILGKIQRERGDLPSARAAFEKVLELDAQNLLALSQLAEIDEDAGDLDAAEGRWRQVAALELDPAFAEARLEAIRALRLAAENEPTGANEPVASREEPTAGESEPVSVSADVEATLADPPAPEPDPEPASVRNTAPDSGDQAPLPATSESEADPTVAESAPARPARRAAVPTAEIATMTLAEIYAEQGFKSKALEIYRQILSRNPQVESLSERIAALEAELAPPAPRPSVELSPAPVRDSGPEEALLDELEGPLEERVIVYTTAEAISGSVPSANPAHQVDSEPQVTPSQPMETPVAAGDEEHQERERFNHFRSWLDRIRVDEN